MDSIAEQIAGDDLFTGCIGCLEYGSIVSRADPNQGAARKPSPEPADKFGFHGRAIIRSKER
jgi:hypothetical protein